MKLSYYLISVHPTGDEDYCTYSFLIKACNWRIIKQKMLEKYFKNGKSEKDSLMFGWGFDGYGECERYVSKDLSFNEVFKEVSFNENELETLKKLKDIFFYSFREDNIIMANTNGNDVESDLFDGLYI